MRVVLLVAVLAVLASAASAIDYKRLAWLSSGSSSPPAAAQAPEPVEGGCSIPATIPCEVGG